MTDIWQAHNYSWNQINDRKGANEVAICRNKYYVAASYDFEKILTFPKINVKEIFYFSKDQVYNFTITEMTDKQQAHNYSWNQINCRKGANEVASIM